MQEILTNILIFTIAIIIHELGHYIGYKLFGHTPSLRITKLGSVLIGENCFYKLKPFPLFITAWLGILTGYFYLTLMDMSDIFILVYIFASGIDFLVAFQIINMPKQYYKKSVGQYYADDCLNTLSKIKTQVKIE